MVALRKITREESFRNVLCACDDESKGGRRRRRRRRTTTKVEPAQARVVRRKFRELTRASAEVLSIKSALERKVKRYEREYGSAM